MVKSCFNNNDDNHSNKSSKNAVKKRKSTQPMKKQKKKKTPNKTMNKLCNMITAPIRSLASTAVVAGKKKVSTEPIITKRKKLPAGLRRNVWIKYNGEEFRAKCHVDFCEAIVTPFTFEVGHDVPVSKGGSDSITNLRPICRSCNVSMSNVYTIEEYSNTFK